MEISRRGLFRTGAAVGGAAALGGTVSMPALAEAAIAGTTASSTLVVASRDGRPGGYAPVVHGAGEPHVARTDLGIAAQTGREARRTPLKAFVQLTDVHVIDVQSPMRVEYLDRFEDTYGGAPAPGLLGSSFRPQEMLTAQVAEAMVRRINQIGVGPVTGAPLAFAVQTGDNTDNCQWNETRWNIDLLDGHKTVRPDSGDLGTFEGVSDGHAPTYDVHYWHPHGNPLLKQPDNYRSKFGFPVIPGLLDAARKPFTASGLNMPWYAAFGNHDNLVQGNFPHSSLVALDTVAQGNTKLVSPPLGASQADLLAGIGGDLATLLGSLSLAYVRRVTADKNRRLLDKKQFIEEHFSTTGAPVGHGFTQENRLAGTGHYVFDQGPLRFIVLDTVNPNGEYDGSIGQKQFAWLKAQLAAASSKLTVLASHHTVASMVNPLVGTGLDGEVRVLGDEVLAEVLQHQHVIAWVNGHTHNNKIWAHARTDGTGGLWEINTASHVDFPQQARLVEVADNHDGTLSIFTTMVDHAGPASYNGNTTSPVPLAGLARELAANDPHDRAANRRGGVEDRNVELLVQSPSGFTG